MKKLTALFVASTLALGAANLAHAADTTTAPSDSKPMMMHHKGGPGQHDMMFKGLNLTDAQKQQIRDIMKSQRENMKRPSLEERRAMPATPSIRRRRKRRSIRWKRSIKRWRCPAWKRRTRSTTF